jgi:hypothetical protein
MRRYKVKKIGRIYKPTVKNLTNNRPEDPNSLLEKALSYSAQGETRLAWGYCAAAAIYSWPAYRGINFPSNATESDCANIVMNKTDNSAEAQQFNKLIKNWIYLAYAGQLPPENGFDEAVKLCKSIGAGNG